VAAEYFTKWVEAKPVTNITVDNAKYFDSAIFKDFCHQVGMKVTFISV
jgi:hypothetical protein